MKFFATFAKQHYLTASFLAIIIIFFVFGCLVLRGVQAIGNLTQTIYEHPLVVSNAALNAGLEITKMHRSMKDVVLTTNTVDMEAALEVVALNEKRVYEHLDLIRANILGDQGENLEKQTRELFMAWKPIRDEVVEQMKRNNRKRAIRITQAKGADHVGSLEIKMLELTSYARSKADSFLSQALQQQNDLERAIFIFVFFGVVLAVTIAGITIYQTALSDKKLQKEKQSLEKALNEIKTLQGILPICSHCKKVRDDKGSWRMIEEYIHKHSDASFSHGICPDCLKEFYKDEMLDE